MRGPNIYMDGIRVTPPSPKPKPQPKPQSKPKSTPKKTTSTSKSKPVSTKSKTTPIKSPAKTVAKPDVDIPRPLSKPKTTPTSPRRSKPTSPRRLPVSKTSLKRAVNYVKRQIAVPDVDVPKPRLTPKPKPQPKPRPTPQPNPKPKAQQRAKVSKPKSQQKLPARIGLSRKLHIVPDVLIPTPAPEKAVSKKKASPITSPAKRVGASDSMMKKIASIEAKRWNAMAQAYLKKSSAKKPPVKKSAGGTTASVSTKKFDVTINDLSSTDKANLKAFLQTYKPAANVNLSALQQPSVNLLLATQTDSTAIDSHILKQWQEQAVIQGMKETKEKLKKGDLSTTLIEAYWKYSPWSTVSKIADKIVEKVTGEKDELSPEAIREKKMKELEALQKTQLSQLEQKRKKIEKQKKQLEAQAQALQMLSKRLQKARKFVQPSGSGAVAYNDEVMIANLASNNLEKQYKKLQNEIESYNREAELTQSQMQKLKEDIDALSPITYKDVKNKAAYLVGGLMGIGADIGAGVLAGGITGAAAGSETAIKAAEGASKLSRLIRSSEKLSKIVSPIKKIASPVVKGLSKVPGKEKIVSAGSKALNGGKWLLTDSKGQVVFLGAMEAPNVYAGYKAGLSVADIALHAGKDIGFGIGFAKGFGAGYKESPAAYNKAKLEIGKKYSRHYLPYEKKTIGNSEVFQMSKLRQGTELADSGPVKNTLLAKTTEIHTPVKSSIATKTSKLRIFSSVADDGTPIVKAVPIEKELTVVRGPSKYFDDILSEFSLKPRTSPLTKTMPINDAFTLKPAESLIPKTEIPKGTWGKVKEAMGVKEAFRTFKPKTPETVMDFSPRTIKKVVEYKPLTSSVERVTIETGKSAVPLTKEEQDALRKMFSFKVKGTSKVTPKPFGKTPIPEGQWRRIVATRELKDVMGNPFSLSRVGEPPTPVDYWETSRIITKKSPIEKFVQKEIADTPKSLEFWTRYGPEGPGKTVPREAGSIHLGLAPDSQKGWSYQLVKGDLNVMASKKLTTPGEQFENYLATGQKGFYKPYSIFDRTSKIDRLKQTVKLFSSKMKNFVSKFKAPVKESVDLDAMFSDFKVRKPYRWPEADLYPPKSAIREEGFWKDIAAGKVSQKEINAIMSTRTLEYPKPFSMAGKTTKYSHDWWAAVKAEMAKKPSKVSVLTEGTAVKAATGSTETGVKAATETTENLDDIAKFLEKVNGKPPSKLKTPGTTQYAPKAPVSSKVTSPGSKLVALQKEVPDIESIVAKGTTKGNIAMRALRQAYKTVTPADLVSDIALPFVTPVQTSISIKNENVEVKPVSPVTTNITPVRQLPVPDVYVQKAKEFINVAQKVSPKTTYWIDVSKPEHKISEKTGWKLHVSIHPEEYIDGLEKVLPVVMKYIDQHKIGAKFAVPQGVHDLANDEVQRGKMVTIYVPEESKHVIPNLITEIETVMKNSNVRPYKPSPNEVVVGKTGAVTTAYAHFGGGDIEVPVEFRDKYGKTKITDQERRLNKDYAIPEWKKREFEELFSNIPEPKKIEPVVEPRVWFKIPVRGPENIWTDVQIPQELPKVEPTISIPHEVTPEVKTQQETTATTPQTVTPEQTITHGTVPQIQYQETITVPDYRTITTDTGRDYGTPYPTIRQQYSITTDEEQIVSPTYSHVGTEQNVENPSPKPIPPEQVQVPKSEPVQIQGTGTVTAPEYVPPTIPPAIPPTSSPNPPEIPFFPDFGGGGGDIAPLPIDDSGAFGFWVGVTPFLGGFSWGEDKGSKKGKKKENPLDKLIEDYIIWLLSVGFSLDEAQKIAAKVIKEMLKKRNLAVEKAKAKASVANKMHRNVPLKKQSLVRAMPMKDMALIKMRGKLL